MLKVSIKTPRSIRNEVFVAKLSFATKLGVTRSVDTKGMVTAKYDYPITSFSTARAAS